MAQVLSPLINCAPFCAAPPEALYGLHRFFPQQEGSFCPFTRTLGHHGQLGTSKQHVKLQLSSVPIQPPEVPKWQRP